MNNNEIGLTLLLTATIGYLLLRPFLSGLRAERKVLAHHQKKSSGSRRAEKLRNSRSV